MSESSAVSDLINRMHSKRLQTDPSDALLFATATTTRARRDDRWFESSLVEPAPVPAPPQVVAPTRRARMPVAPPKGDRVRVTLLIMATIAAGVLGVYGASRVQIGDDAPAASIPSMDPAPIESMPEVAPPAPPAPPATIDQPNVVAPPDTNVATAAPVVETSMQPAPAIAPAAPTPTHHAIKRKKASVKRAKPSVKHTAVR